MPSLEQRKTLADSEKINLINLIDLKRAISAREKGETGKEVKRETKNKAISARINKK